MTTGERPRRKVEPIDQSRCEAAQALSVYQKEPR